ncbi:MAG TPA: hypothetical protein VN922_03160 [Bacteroidia bacterium]|nr:hypothetical protein [Bacteroidia bacterium]
MKTFLTFSLLFFHLSLVFAQQDSGKTTFHVRPVIDTENGISFVIPCEENFKQIFIDEKGGAYFFWGKMMNPTSASFSADTASVDTVRNIITPAFVDAIDKCTLGCSMDKEKCPYWLFIYVDGLPKYAANIDISCTGKDKCGNERLQRLINLLNTFDKRYRFPK